MSTTETTGAGTRHRLDGNDGLVRVIGVSLGGPRGKTTAVARIERREGGWALVEARSRGEHRGAGLAGGYQGPLRDETLLGYLQSWLTPGTVIAIDAPLTLPACLPCALSCPGEARCGVEEVEWLRSFAESLRDHGVAGKYRKRGLAPYAARPTDVVADHVCAGGNETARSALDPIAARAVYLRRALASRARLNEELIEVDPKLSLQRWFGPQVVDGTRRGETQATWSQRLTVLSACTRSLTIEGVWPELVVRSPPVFHACIAAVTALRREQEGWAGPPQTLEMDQPSPVLDLALHALAPFWRSSGWIWIPPSTGFHS